MDANTALGFQQSGIYAISRIGHDNRYYIGSAISVHRRRQDHIKRLVAGNHHSKYLQNAWNKYGRDAFEFTFLESVPDRSKLVSREQVWMDRFNPVYNVCKVAGSCLGKECTAETRSKIGAAARGRKLSPETRAKMSAARKGRPGKRHSEETRAKLSLARLGKPGPKHTPESRAKIAAANTGKKRQPLTAELRARLSVAHLGNQNRRGIPHSPEIRAQISRSLRDFYMRRKSA